MNEVRKISVSIPPAVVDRVKLAAEAMGESVSAWITNAALRQLSEQSRLEIGRLAAEELVSEYEAEHGEIPLQVVTDVDAFFAQLDGRRSATLRDAG